MVSWTIGRGQSLPRAVLPERLSLDCQHQSDTSCSLKNKRYLTQVRTLVNRALTDKDPRRAVMVVDRCMVLPYLEASTLLEQLKREGWTSRTDTASRSILQRDGWSAGVVVREPDRGLCRVEYDGLEGKGAQERSLFGYTMRIDTKRQTETYRYRKDYQSYMDLLDSKEYRKLFYRYKKDDREQLVEVMDELYVLEHEYLSTDEMKERTSALGHGQLPIPYPDASVVSPLNKRLQEIMATMEPE